MWGSKGSLNSLRRRIAGHSISRHPNAHKQSLKPPLKTSCSYTDIDSNSLDFARSPRSTMNGSSEAPPLNGVDIHQPFTPGERIQQLSEVDRVSLPSAFQSRIKINPLTLLSVGHSLLARPPLLGHARPSHTSRKRSFNTRQEHPVERRAHPRLRNRARSRLQQRPVRLHPGGRPHR